MLSSFFWVAASKGRAEGRRIKGFFSCFCYRCAVCFELACCHCCRTVGFPCRALFRVNSVWIWFFLVVGSPAPRFGFSSLLSVAQIVLVLPTIFGLLLCLFCPERYTTTAEDQ